MMPLAKIPPGKHIIELRYWPDRFTEGLVIAAIAVVGFVIAAIVAWRRDIIARRQVGSSKLTKASMPRTMERWARR